MSEEEPNEEESVEAESSNDEAPATEEVAAATSEETPPSPGEAKPAPRADGAKWPYALGAALALVVIYFAFLHRSGSSAEVEDYLLSRAGEDIGEERIEDVEPRRVWRLDLIQLDGLDSLSEALVDFDRDERYDERWEFFTDGRIRRHHSTEDDGRYDRIEMRVDGEWTESSSEDAIGLPEDLEQAIGSALEAATGHNVDSEEAESIADEGVRTQAEIWLLTQQGRELEVPLVRDAREGVSWHVDLFQADDASTITGAHLDLDRDGNADQRWTYDGEERVIREVSSADDEVYDQVWEWSDDGWQEARP